MSNRKTAKPAEQVKLVRCAVYTRKSTEEGLEQEFNSLDAQRESGEAYVAAQKHEGWVCLSDRYDDGGYTGGNMERPALRRLLADIDAGKIDCVVVYKVDRLSRSLMDFARIMQVFDGRNVSFVSVTQQFNTTHSMGRLTLNILLSFAQFEREIISERTRDKIAAARKKGKFSGGLPLLGYDIRSSPVGAKLVVNEEEARRVRGIFELYKDRQALIPVVTELSERGWCNKQWVTKKAGQSRGGRPFDKTSLYRLLTNKTYVGLTTHKGEAYEGEHTGIVPAALFHRVQAILRRNGNTGGAGVRNRYGALLKGILSCSCCRCSMMHTYSVKRAEGAGGSKRYRYYVCVQAQKRGWATCATKSVPAAQIEQFVVEQIKGIGKDPAVLEGTLRQVRQQAEKALVDARAEQRAFERELTRHHGALKKLIATPDPGRLADISDRVQDTERRLAALREHIQKLERERVDDQEVKAALAAFDPVWEQLAPREQARVIRLLVDRVEYDGRDQTVSISFHPSGIKHLAQEQLHEVAA